jgi:GT2 family glycosyltransferase
VASVSIIIVSWNAREPLGRCLASLSACPHEVIVVDNASADGSAGHVASRFPGVALVEAPMNLGFAGAINLGSRHASGEFLLVLSSDVAPHPGAIDTLMAFLDIHRKHGAVAGRLEAESGRTRPGWSFRRFPTFGSLAVRLLLIDKLWPRNPATRYYHALDIDQSRVTDVEQPPAACLMLRRAAFESVGRMDEAFYPAWFEDVDLCRRLRAKGWRVAFHPSAVFTRIAPDTKRQLTHDAFTRLWYRNLQRYARKHHGLAGDLFVKLLILVGMGLRMLICVLRRDRAGFRAFRRVSFDVFSPSRFTRLMDQLSEQASGSVKGL